ncbi:nuclear pore complex protein Nup50 [Schistocerca gregaria]|uniref:nuclear pore complex protein Nup50 n=1 Tax=Schistocerca gregaria TaxID=7010 RepID=UPI00211E2CBE|nr:nuclear pore complex protein Nup50 [Schistocerca gregaria]
MAKRIASSDLNHDNWDKEDKREEAGTFRKADDSTLQSRVIRQAKRRSTSSPYSSSGSPPKTGETKSVFANFSGFKMPTSTSTVTFNFGSGGTAAADGSSSSKESSSAPIQQKNGVLKGSSNEMSTRKDAEGKNDMDRYTKKPKEFYADLRALNECVSKWIKMHVERNSCCILTPVFKDYERHLSDLEDKYTTSKNVDTEPSKKEMWSIPAAPKDMKSVAQESFNFSFGLKSSGDKFSSSGYFSTPPITKTLDNKNVQEEPSKTPSSSVLPPLNQKLVSPTQASTLSSSEEKNKSPLQFSFGSQKPFTFANVSKPEGGSGENDKDGKDDNEEPPKAEFTPVVEKDAVYSQRCKVFVKKGGSFQDRGVGTLFLKPVSGGAKTQLLVRADTSLGNVLLNTLLFQSMPLQRMGTNNVMLVCVPTPEAEPPPIPVLLRVKTAEDADKLLETLKQYIK